MESALVEILGNIYFWVFIGSLVGALFSLRLANANRDQAAFADFPDKPEKYIFRSRIFYLLTVLFSLAVLVGMVVTGYHVFRVVQPQISLNLPEISQAAGNAPTPTEVPTEAGEDEAAESQDAVTPTPQQTLAPTPAPEEDAQGEYALAVIGNTNFQGVNVRAEPSLNAEIITRLVNQTKVFVFSAPQVEADGYTWRRVQLEDDEIGWIAEPFLIFQEEPE